MVTYFLATTRILRDGNRLSTVLVLEPGRRNGRRKLVKMVPMRGSKVHEEDVLRVAKKDKTLTYSSYIAE